MALTFCRYNELIKIRYQRQIHFCLSSILDVKFVHFDLKTLVGPFNKVFYSCSKGTASLEKVVL